MPTSEDRSDAVIAEAEKLLKGVTQAHEWQCLRRDRDDGRIEYQIFADSEPEGEQIAWVQSTRCDAELIAAAPYLVRDLLAVIAALRQEIQELQSRVDSVPGSAHGDLPRRPPGDKSAS